MDRVIVSNICGFCGGARRSLDLVRQAVNKGSKVVLFKELLHNKNVILELEKSGVVTKNSLLELSKNDLVVIRGHGEPLSTFEFLENNGIKYIDGTCPNVKVINRLVKQKDDEGYKIIIIGKCGLKSDVIHPEVEGTAGWCHSPIFIEEASDIEKINLSFDKYYLVVQTTFSKDKAEKLIEKIKKLMQKSQKVFEYKNTICNAQKLINTASLELAQKVDIMLVMGGKNSSNTKELYNALNKVARCEFIEGPEEAEDLIKKGVFDNVQKIGITAGASTMQEDIEKLKHILEKELGE